MKSEKISSGENLSYWIDSVNSSLSFLPLANNLKTDVVVVGGGISGITVAYCLLKKGKKVVLVEDGNIGSGETGRTTAHLVNALDDRYFSLADMFGKSNTKLIAESHTRAIDFVEKVVRERNIDCDFERLPGYLFKHETDKEDLEKEFTAAKEAGVDIDQVNEVPGLLQSAIHALRFNNQAQFHPLKYIKGLCEAITEMGGLIYTDTHAQTISSEGIITDKGFKIDAAHVVVATNTPVNNKFVMHLKQYPHRSYVIGAKIKKGLLPRALWWDTGDHSANDTLPPYHYVRVQPYDEQHDLLISGGEDHPTALADVEKIPEENRYALVEDWTRKHFEIGEIVYRWSGQVLEPMDSLAYIGKNPMDKDNVYIITGDSGNGMTHGTIGGMLISDLITGVDKPWKEIYDPARFKIFSAGKTFFKELLGGLIDYMKTKPEPTEAKEFYKIKPHEGKIVSLGKTQYGVYRDDEDYFHMVSAECTHLKCIIKWNNDEKSWDCPCHGSRFTHTGKVMNGPANVPLPYHKASWSNISLLNTDKQIS